MVLTTRFLPLAVSAERSEFAIRRFVQEGDLLDPESEIPAIQRVAQFLGDAKHGHKLFRDLRLDGRVVETSKAYGKALDVFVPILKKSRSDIEKMDLGPILNEYTELLDRFVAFARKESSEGIEQEKLEKLRAFLEALRTLLFDELAAPVERLTVPKRS